MCACLCTYNLLLVFELTIVLLQVRQFFVLSNQPTMYIALLLSALMISVNVMQINFRIVLIDQKQLTLLYM